MDSRNLKVPEATAAQLDHLLGPLLEAQDAALTDPRDLVRRARLAREAKQYPRALRLARRALELDSGHLAPAAVLCAVHRECGNPRSGLQETERFARSSHPALLNPYTGPVRVELRPTPFYGRNVHAPAGGAGLIGEYLFTSMEGEIPMDDTRTSPPRPGTIPPASCSSVKHLGNEELRQRALSASVTLVKGRLILGDCLLEMLERELFWIWGYSSMNQFVRLFLKVDPKEAKDARFVARRLRMLPLLREAAEAGQVHWTHLYEVCRVATPETEEEWLAAARKPSIRRLRRLVALALRGQPPSEDPLETPLPVLVRFGMDMLGEEAELQQGAIASLSADAGRPLTAREAHMELYRAAVEGRIRTSARGVVETEEVLRDMARMRAEQDEREAVALREEVQRQREAPAEEPEPAPAPAEEGLTSDPIPAPPVEDGLTSDPAPPVDDGLTPAPAPPWTPSFMKTVGLTSDPYTLRDLSSEVKEEGLPDLPWAAAQVEETPCPGNPDLFVLTPSKRTEEPEIGCSCTDCREGRSRHIPRWVRRRVMRRDGFRCQCPDCPHNVWLDLHHIVFWCRGGLSVPANLVLLCRRCHRNLHKGRLRIQGNAELGLTFLDACGRVLGSTTAAQVARAAEFADGLLLCGQAA